MVSRGKKVGSTPESRVAISDVLLNRRKSSEGHQRGAMAGDLSISNKRAWKEGKQHVGEPGRVWTEHPGLLPLAMMQGSTTWIRAMSSTTTAAPRCCL